ncbi:uncharacterized protein LOC111010543 [Momordica charantia]|uniref:Uncharacterized protein LOC111010543 n=1 Tax=Momordica charantia TaxID=3673 RepID=A0A6J1CDH5_MOMCH|nr:uncharacterized protein LOC111010543 [Momordica charantia]
MDSDAAKSRKKTKLFPCFRSPASDCYVRTERCKDVPDEKVFPLMAVEEMDGTMFHSVRSVASSKDADDEDSGCRKRKGSGGALSRAIKAVLFGTALAKKMRKKKAKQKQNSKKENQIRHHSVSSISDRSRIASDPYHNYSNFSSRTSMPFSSSSFCSSSPSSSDISERSFAIYPTAPKRLFSQINLRRICSGWLMFLVCILSLILWGKICAIVCTSVWILCFSSRRFGFKSPEIKASAAAIDSGEHNKRIVIEGLLARDRSAAQNSSLRID